MRLSSANYPAPGKAKIAPQLTIGHFWPRLPEPGFSANPPRAHAALTLFKVAVAVLCALGVGRSQADPLLTNPGMTGSAFVFTLQSQPNLCFDILATTNHALPISNWTSLGTLTNTAGTIPFLDPVPNLNGGFYLARFNAGATLQNNFNVRRASYINTCLTGSPGNKYNLILEAYTGQPLNGNLQAKVNNVAANGDTADFDMADLVRILYLGARGNETAITNAAATFYFWLKEGDTNSCWWSENHSILYMSSHWLFYERYGWQGYDFANLRTRLVQWLTLRNTYGFFEFYSKVYSPYSLAGMLNLADFAQDSQIKSLATSAAQRCLSDLLLTTDAAGASYSAAGRDYYRVAKRPWGHNHNRLVHLLTGSVPISEISPSQGGAMLATSSLDISGVYAYWNTDVNARISLGFPMANMDAINSMLNTDDKAIFHWNASAYACPDQAVASFHLITKYNWWNNPVFSAYKPLQGASDAQVSAAALTMTNQTLGWVLTPINVNVYKHDNTLLSSVEQYYAPGTMGDQMLPWIATTGTNAVWMVCGNGTNFPSDSAGCTDFGLPAITQTNNVALMIYHPHSGVWSGTNTGVLLYWKANAWTESIESGLWNMAREGNSYVAVRAFDANRTPAGDRWSDVDPQTWVVVVGNSTKHGSFSNFTNMINAVTVTNGYNASAKWAAGVTADGTTLNLTFP